ncbi:hypothetical protein WJX73_009118 [Symbiochloris irregularis]|uniref:Uncharacterized protein n=1 Tax=Symbiochloris irregularis TaxID=706552 RepID=A0AAW1PUG9_9CHLO
MKLIGQARRFNNLQTVKDFADESGELFARDQLVSGYSLKQTIAKSRTVRTAVDAGALLVNSGLNRVPVDIGLTWCSKLEAQDAAIFAYWDLLLFECEEFLKHYDANPSTFDALQAVASMYSRVRQNHDWRRYRDEHITDWCTEVYDFLQSNIGSKPGDSDGIVETHTTKWTPSWSEDDGWLRYETYMSDWYGCLEMDVTPVLTQTGDAFHLECHEIHVADPSWRDVFPGPDVAGRRSKELRTFIEWLLHALESSSSCAPCCNVWKLTNYESARTVIHPEPSRW